MTKELRTVATSKVKPYENNPRLNDGAVESVRKSIEQCGYVAPIVVDEDMVILAGHTRLKALKAMGRKECEVLVVSGLDEEQKRKYRLLDNKTNELALWDFDKLAYELEGLDFDDLALDWMNNLEDIAMPAYKEPTNEELDLEDFDDDEFECECPRCGFRFNR